MWLKEGTNYYPSYACSQPAPGSLSISDRFCCPPPPSYWKMGDKILEPYPEISLYRWAKATMYLNDISTYEIQRFSEKTERQFMKLSSKKKLIIASAWSSLHQSRNNFLAILFYVYIHNKHLILEQLQ